MTDALRYINRRSARYRLDPRAVMAVSRVESGGRRNAVGDQGTSYGPFQLHRGGALPRGRDAAWAGSNAGIDYALRQMSQYAGGLKGKAAVDAIVRRFERPADPNSEIRKAISFYGGSSGALSGVPNTTNDQGEFKLSSHGVGQDPRAGIANFMMDNLMHFRATGETMQLNNFYALNKMMQDSAGPSPTETKPIKESGAVGRGVPDLAAGAGDAFPLGSAGYTWGGGMAAHGARALGNWQSDRAVDLMTKGGTPVYAMEGGVIRGGFGDSGNKGTVYGKRLSVYSPSNAFFYQHLGRYGPGIAPGRRVRKGQLLGYVGAFPGKPAPHLHLGIERGNPYGLLTRAPKRRR